MKEHLARKSPTADLEIGQERADLGEKDANLLNDNHPEKVFEKYIDEAENINDRDNIVDNVI